MLTVAAANVRPGLFVAIIIVSAFAGTLSAVVRIGGLVIPTVVLELVFGVVLGRHVIGLQATPFVAFIANVGLGMLFFFVGYEVDFARISGAPLRLAVSGWTLSLAIAYAVGGVLAAAGVVLSLLYTGSALATTALGTLLPVLSDADQLRTRLGTCVLAAGAVGEFGPVLLITLVLSAEGTVRSGIILIAFVGIAAAVGVFTLRSSRRTFPVLERTIEASTQVAVRCTMVLIFALAALAYKLGLDLLLGGFAAGMIMRQLLKTNELPEFDSKLTAIGFGVFVPFFFIVSGMKLDVTALFASPGGAVKCLLFFVLFLVVRGTPALLLYGRVLDRRERVSLGLLSSTQLALVVAITDLATASGHMRASTAAALVGAAVLSTLVFPMAGMKVATAVPHDASLVEAADV
jgi:Kef-type K+ transport system membrane component KefB